jgi:uncharacterized protein YcbX
MTNAFCASVNFDAFTPNLLAQPRMSTAENSSREWSSFQVAEQRFDFAGFAQHCRAQRRRIDG